MTREEVMAEARKLVGTPYRQRGRTAEGIDCIGVLVAVGKALGVPHEDSLDYASWPAQDHRILSELGRYLTLMPPSSPKPGLIGVFAERRLPGHVGIFTWKHGQDHVVHARMSLGARVVTEDALSSIPRSEMRLIALFAFPGLEP